MKDSNPKALTFGEEEHNAPLADISHLSACEKARLKSKALGAFGTYDYDKFKSDEEFELALACLAPYYWGNNKYNEYEYYGIGMGKDGHLGVDSVVTLNYICSTTDTNIFTDEDE